MTALFVSDLHLSDTTPKLNRAFSRFLQLQAAHVDQLFILGDLFETWLGDDDPSVVATDISLALRQLSDSGVQLFVMRGNRDFLLGARFAEKTGAILLNDPSCLEIEGHEILLVHGDSLCSDDIRYQRYRKKIQHPISTTLLRLSPLCFRQWLARGLRSKSSRDNSQKHSYIMDVNADAVTAACQRHDVKLMIHGHTHRPAVHTDAKYSRYVLGDWGEQLWYIKVTATEIALLSEIIPA